MLDVIRILVWAVETGCSTAAKPNTSQPNPAISRQIAAPETRLGVRLPARGTRHLTVTNAAIQPSPMQDLMFSNTPAGRSA